LYLNREDMQNAGFEDYSSPAGIVKNDTLRITLEARPAKWQPWGPDGPAIYAHVFAVDGLPPRIPGPLIRFKAGTPVQVTVRNTLPDTLAVRGLRDQGKGGGLPGILADQLVLPPETVYDIEFTSHTPGTFTYWAERLSRNVQPETKLPGSEEADRGLRGC